MQWREIQSSTLPEAYKRFMMQRYEEAQSRVKGRNCHDAAYYVLGVHDEEYTQGEGCSIYDDVLEPTESFKEAVLIAFGSVHHDGTFDPERGHVAVIHPYDSTKIIERDLTYYVRPENNNLKRLLSEVNEAFFTEGEMNPIRIEPLEKILLEYQGSDIRLFRFKKEYFTKLLRYRNISETT